MILLKLPGIPGDVNISKSGFPQECIACTSCSWDIEREFKESGKAGTMDINLGVADLPSISLGKSMDKASVYLMQNSIAGSSLGTAEIYFLTSSGVDSDGEVFLEFKLNNAIVQSWNISGDEDDRPNEEIKLWYNKIWMQYFQSENGKDYTSAGSKGWDRVANKAWDGT